MMTDNEIIKALSFCGGINYMDDCPEESEDCYCNIAKYAFNLINRQKAEIEKLEKRNIKNCRNWQSKYNSLRAEAIKEFAERYKALLETELAWCECVDDITKPLDNLVKEMVGDV